MLTEVHRVSGQIPTKAGEILVRKMKIALLPSSTIENALTLRTRYRRHTIKPKYQQEDEYKDAEMELTAVLNHMVAQLDNGFISRTGGISRGVP